MQRLFVLVSLAVATLISSNAAFAEVSVHGYWRLGLNTMQDLTQAAVQDGGLQEQGEHKLFYDIPTSRHANNPSYFWMQAIKTLDSGVKGVIKVDHAGNTAHHHNNWGASDQQMFTVRDLYVEMPTGNNSSIWAGSRYYEFEDIRLLDVLNVFNYNMHGAGYHWGSSLVGISFNHEAVKFDEDHQRERQTTTLVMRTEIPLAANYSFKPMAQATVLGGLPQEAETPEAHRIKPTQRYRLGGVLTRWGEGFWGNTHFWAEITPHDLTGQDSGRDRHIGLGESCSYDFGSFGLLFAAWLQHEQFHAAKTVFRISDGALASTDKTARSVFKGSLAIQPVFYLTDAIHAAIDLNVTQKSKKVSENDFNSTLVTPIIRYSAERSALGVPQIYTSVTWGHYDWQAKRSLSGKPTDTLVTTQTGFEIWF